MRYLVASVVALFFIAFLIPVTPASAADTVPTKMNFQGRLTDTAGNVKANGTYNMRFKLYTVSSGGTNVWAEDYLVSAAQGVTIANGSFSVQLGSITILPASLFASGPLYLEVEFPTPATANTASPVWTEGAMTPRNQMLTSAYAFNAETVDGIDGAALAQLSTNNTFSGTNSLQATSATAFRVQSAAAANTFLTVDTSGGQVSIGNAAGDATAVLLKLDDKNTTGDPAGVAGATYYNSADGKFRCFQTVWMDCIAAGGSSTFQNIYNNSASPVVITTTAAKGINITAGAAPTADMLAISNAGFGTTTAGVNGLSINYVGGAGAIEASGAKIDLTPGTTTGSTWNGLRIVANATGAAAGVSVNGLDLEGPTTLGAGNEVAININANWDAGIRMESKLVEPAAPTAGGMYVYAGKYAGRSLLSQKGASGVSFAFQPALFQQRVGMMMPNATTTISTWGIPFALMTGLSTTTPVTEAFGVSTNMVTTTTAGSSNGIQETTAQHYMGTVSKGGSGFFSVNRVSFPDANYGTGTTGSRIWVGMTSQANAASASVMTNSDNPAGSFAGFQYSTNRGDTNWQFMTKDASVLNTINTGVAFTVNKVYDMYIYAAPFNGSTPTVYWRIDNLTDGTSTDGSTTTSMPVANTALRPATTIQNLGTTVRQMRVNKMYIETDL